MFDGTNLTLTSDAICENMFDGVCKICELLLYTTLTKLSTKYLVMCKVYTDVGGIK